MRYYCLFDLIFYFFIHLVIISTNILLFQKAILYAKLRILINILALFVCLLYYFLKFADKFNLLDYGTLQFGILRQYRPEFILQDAVFIFPHLYLLVFLL